MKGGFLTATALVGLLLNWVLPAEAQFGVALNATNLTWTTTGTPTPSASWGIVNNPSHDGVSAAQSGSISGNQSATSTLQTTITGPGKLTFWWQSPASDNQLEFMVNGVRQSVINMVSSWEQQTHYFPAGTHTLKWVSSVAGGSFSSFGRSYLDEVTYTPGATVPVLLYQTPSQSQVSGLNATFTVKVGATPPLSYQWQFNEQDIAGATNSSFTVTNVATERLGQYRVIATNSAGSIISTNAALVFGEVTAWGYTGSGETVVTPDATNIIAISAGISHALVLKADGTLTGWGTNRYGQLSFPPQATNLIAISTGTYHALGLRADGSVIEWGQPPFPQVPLPSDLANIVAITVGDAHNLALRADGTVVAWGMNSLGGTNVPAGLSNVVGIAIGTYESFAIKADGTVIKWGSVSSPPAIIPAGLSNVAAIAGGFTHNITLQTDGTVGAWSRYSLYGETNVPAGLTNVTAIAASFYHSAALRKDGTVVAWGRSLAGETNVPAGLTNVIALDGENSYYVALVANHPPVTQAVAEHAQWSEAGFEISVPTQSGRVFALEHTDNLAEPHWVALPLVAGTGKAVTLKDPSPATGQRFYRVRRW